MATSNGCDLAKLMRLFYHTRLVGAEYNRLSILLFTLKVDYSQQSDKRDTQLHAPLMVS